MSYSYRDKTCMHFSHQLHQHRLFIPKHVMNYSLQEAENFFFVIKMQSICIGVACLCLPCLARCAGAASPTAGTESTESRKGSSYKSSSGTSQASILPLRTPGKIPTPIPLTGSECAQPVNKMQAEQYRVLERTGYGCITLPWLEKPKSWAYLGHVSQGLLTRHTACWLDNQNLGTGSTGITHASHSHSHQNVIHLASCYPLHLQFLSSVNQPQLSL